MEINKNWKIYYSCVRFKNKTQKNTTIYVTTYEDRIVILNNASKICDIENLGLNKYIGVTSTDPKVATIYAGIVN